jgi:methylase of polypeptide subunit release factors
LLFGNEGKSVIPLQFGSPEQFAATRQFLIDSRYTEEALCERCEVQHLFDSAKNLTERLRKPIGDSLDLLIRVFLDGFSADEEQFCSLLGSENLKLLRAFGFLIGTPENASVLYSPVSLYPVKGCFIISDRGTSPEGVSFESKPDVVYPALISNTQRFLDLMPRDRCEQFLDLCSGTGIAAFLAARDFAEHAYAFDIAERSTQFAEFNRRLNGIDNVMALQGDLYEPANGQTFDCIVAHPPYVPVLQPKWIFHDGGEDGESVVRRIVEGLPQYLRPGGLFYMLAMGTDRADAPYEQRIRGWLGSRQHEFDVAVIARRQINPTEFVVQSMLKGGGNPAETNQWKQLFARLKVTSLVYGVTQIRRRDTDRNVFTARREFGDRARVDETKWLFDWEASVAAGTGAARVLRAKLRAAAGIELRVVNQLQDGEWAASEYLLIANYPFSMELKTQPWVAYLLSKCDGLKTGLEHMNHLIEENVVHPDTGPEEFAEALTLLVSGGFIEMNEPA